MDSLYQRMFVRLSINSIALDLDFPEVARYGA